MKDASSILEQDWLTDERRLRLKCILLKDPSTRSPDEVSYIDDAMAEYKRRERDAKYRIKPEEHRVNDHQRVWAIVGAYTAFIVAIALATISSGRTSGYVTASIALWLNSLTFLCGFMLLDYRMRVVQKRETGAMRGLMFFMGFSLSHIGTVSMMLSYSWLAGIVILPQFLGHPDKRLNIAIRGETDEGKDQDGGQGQPEPL